MKKQYLTRFVLVAALVLSLSGTLFASTEIVFWHFFGIGDAGEPWVIQEWVDRFNASQNEYVVVPQNQPWGPGMYEKLVLATAADTVPDVIVVHDWAMPNLARIGVLAQLQDNQLSALGIDPSGLLSAGVGFRSRRWQDSRDPV